MMNASPPSPAPRPSPLRIALLDDYQKLAPTLADWQSLPAGTEVLSFAEPAPDAATLVGWLRDVDVLVAMRERTAFPGQVLEQLPRLKLIVSAGLHNAAIDLAACRRLGIATTGARSSAGGPGGTVEITFALVLALHKHLVQSHEALRAGHWQPRLAEGLHGKVLGIVGLGTLGQGAAQVGKAFGMDVIAWSPNLTAQRAARAGVTQVDKAALFARADTVSLHLVLSETTRGIVGAAELALMKPSAFLVNTARAGLVDEQALLDALRARRIAGAGLDVFWQEPLPAGHALHPLDNVVLSPHLGYATTTNMAAFYRHALAGIHAWIDGRELTPLA